MNLAQLAHQITHQAAEDDGPILAITANSHQASDLLHQLRFFLGKEEREALLFPDKEVLPYDSFSPHSRINSRRIRAFYRLLALDYRVLISSVDNLMHRVPPPSYFMNKGIMLSMRQKLEREIFIRQLEQAGYARVEQVREPGELALRGSLLDIYPTGALLPYRVDWLDEEIDSIRTFSPQDQRSLEQVESVELLPAYEFPFTAAAKKDFCIAWQRAFSAEHRQHRIYLDLRRGFTPQGLENYLPFFFTNLHGIFDYLVKPHRVLTTEDCFAAARDFGRSVEERYKQRSHSPVLPPAQLFFSEEEVKQALKNHIPQSRMRCYGALPSLVVNFRADNRISRLVEFIQSSDSRILLCLNSVSRVELVAEWLQQAGIPYRPINSWEEFISGSVSLGLTRSEYSGGLVNTRDNWAIITEMELFDQSTITSRKAVKGPPPELLFKNLAQLQKGELVVHIDYGVGCFKGLKKISHSGYCQEYLAVEYDEKAILYLPVNNLHLISRYIGDKERGLDSLTSHSWNLHKAKAIRRIQDTAAQLLAIYARRASQKGLVCAPPRADYEEFVARFPFQETVDQQKAVHQIIEDMLSDKVMDRLVCGDVGFGKTEVAMRAAYLAAMSGYQVAVLVPTRLLAQQHLDTFKERFAATPVRIDCLLADGGKQLQLKEEVSEGKIDIVIGTHSLLHKTVRFKQLGLVVIDEEHRFGVRQKERLKDLRSDVEVLSLTATPIPRTLNLALAGLRDISLMASPPKERLAVKTFVRDYDRELIQEAIAREVLRGGQIYYVFNNIAEIDRRASQLEKLFPNIRVAVIHGKMPKHQMEKTMHDFYHNRFDLLVCTTIVENGLDVPNANTLIIERADKFGMAQLHQLRGRVGRRSHQAYAYLLTEGPVGGDARKRLQAIGEAQELGLGFTLSTYDLEIRGAGEILGDEQSGTVERIGLELYTYLLERTVYALRHHKPVDLGEMLTEVDLSINAYLPDEYIADVYERLILYKRISSTDEQTLADLRAELMDRFGDIPPPAAQLLELQLLRLNAQRLGIRAIKANRSGAGMVALSSENDQLMKQVCKLVKSQPDQFTLTPTARLRFQFSTRNDAGLLSELHRLLRLLEVAAETTGGEKLAKQGASVSQRDNAEVSQLQK